MDTPPAEKKFRPVSFAAHATRGILRDRKVRRVTTLLLLVGALLMVIAGSTFLREPLDAREHAGRFAIFWLVCAWLTGTSLLLALFDLLLVRAEARAAGKRLREAMTRTEKTGE